jgi:hypothetical protein
MPLHVSILRSSPGSIHCYLLKLYIKTVSELLRYINTVMWQHVVCWYVRSALCRERLRWSRGCVLASSTEVRGFKPGRSHQIFQGQKIPSTPSFGGEVKLAVPCHRFAACKRSLNVTWKSAFRQNSRLLFLAH